MEIELIKSKVNKILVDRLFIDEGMIKDDASLVDDLGCDSLDRVELIMDFESEFNINIPDERSENCETVKDLYDMLDELLLFDVNGKGR